MSALLQASSALQLLILGPQWLQYCRPPHLYSCWSMVHHDCSPLPGPYPHSSLVRRMTGVQVSGLGWMDPNSWAWTIPQWQGCRVRCCSGKISWPNVLEFRKRCSKLNLIFSLLFSWVVREFRSILDRFYVLCTHFHTFFSGPGPKKKKCPQDRAPWSLGENLPSGPCFLVPRRKFVSGMQVSVHFGPILCSSYLLSHLFLGTIYLLILR